MNFLNPTILFFTALAGGIAYQLFPQLRKANIKYILMFAGSYLLSITIVHILPEVFGAFPDPAVVGIFVLAGFFLQLILEFFSRGIEHGHTHVHTSAEKEIHFHSPYIISLMSGLILHSILEGMIVVNPPVPVFHHHAGGIMLGIVLHKIPESFALMTVLQFSDIRKSGKWLNLILFSLASPVGVLISYIMNLMPSITILHISVIYGIVSGTFLYISTTIFFETSPGHHFNLKKLMFALGGASLALVIEMFI
ncbi:MAG TPA: ZIP family metal transporter [Cyclobacteriaceae bacterium]|nr:ZIP family metal transporter [Cyclobacteriaceae bacterium]